MPVIRAEGGHLSVSDPGLRRVSIHAGNAVVDVVLPRVPVAALVPPIVDFLEGRGTEGPTIDGEALSASLPGCRLCTASTTLAQNDIRDGDVLILSQSGTGYPHPVTTTWPRPCRRRSTRRPRVARSSPSRPASRRGGGGLLDRWRWLGADSKLRLQPLTVPSTSPRRSPVGRLVADVGAFAHRAYRDPVAGLTLSVIATAFAAAGGLSGGAGRPRCAPCAAGRDGGGRHVGVGHAHIGLWRRSC